MGMTEKQIREKAYRFGHLMKELSEYLLWKTESIKEELNIELLPPDAKGSKGQWIVQGRATHSWKILKEGSLEECMEFILAKYIKLKSK